MDKKLNTIRNRPRFKIYTNLSGVDFEKNLKIQIQKSNEITGNINNEVATIFVNSQYDTYWKPYLSLRIEKEENKTVIRGIFSPSAAVWTFFMFLYLVFSIVFMIFITIWLVTKQIKSNDFPWAIHVTIASFILLILTYAAAKVGQKLAKPELEKLKIFAEKNIFIFEE